MSQRKSKIILNFLRGAKKRSRATVLRSCGVAEKIKLFPFTPLPFACKGGEAGSEVIKLKFPQKYLPDVRVRFGFID